ncbi:MAG: flagellar filament outer layer protein FlaA [Treponema sp.]|nr:flagellar filament outer layer protein FlaA [Treponema sp.]
MKQGGFRAVRLAIFLLVMLGLTGFLVFADENTVNIETIVLEDFNGGANNEWFVGGRLHSYNFEWRADASRFATVVGEERFPRLSFVEAWPQAAFGVNRDGLDLRSLGIWARFDRRGYNWVDVYPVAAGTGQDGDYPEPFEIPLPGRLQTMDMWVWGMNQNLTLEAYFRDHNGVVHAVPMGSLAFIGWRNLNIRIPNHIPQSRRTLPRLAGLTFVKFRIWTMPTERVDNIFVYFKQLKIVTDTFESLFDGSDLSDPERILELWAQ